MLAENDLKSERTKHSHAGADTEYLRVSAAARQRRRRGASRRRGGSACRRRREKGRTTGGGRTPRMPAPPRGEPCGCRCVESGRRLAGRWRRKRGGASSEQARLVRLPVFFFFFWLGWAAWLLASGVASSARGKARLDRDGPGPCASYKG